MWVADISRARTPLSFVLNVSRPYIRWAIISSIFVVCGAIMGTASVFALKKIIDLLTTGGIAQINYIWMWVAVYIAMDSVGSPLFWRLSGLAGMKWSLGAKATATQALAAYATQHSSEYFNKRFAGAIGSKISNASQGVRSLIEDYLWTYLEFVVILVTTIWLIFSASVLVGWIFVGWFVIAAPINTLLARRRIPALIDSQAKETLVRARVIDMVTNVGAMHNFARSHYEVSTLEKLIDLRYWAGTKSWRMNETNRVYNQLIALVFVVVVVGVTIWLWGQGGLSVGSVVLVLSLMGTMQSRVKLLGQNFNHFAERHSEVREGLDDIVINHEIVDKPLAKKLKVERGSVEFKNAVFSYDGGREVLSDFSLTIEPGQKVGLLGRSGAGKSTLVKLLLRHYELTGGSICIDGQDISHVTQDSLRQNIAVVPQEPALFHRTIKENIQYGRLDATDEEIVEAAKLARAHDFIERLPLGYDTLVGERGVKLSGGERQRVAFARAILSRARILVLDEATSSLDSESEAAIQTALHELMQGRTVVAIAHRLSTLREMDRLLVLDEGRVVEDGTHTSLLKKKGLYSELWAHQSGGYIQE